MDWHKPLEHQQQQLTTTILQLFFFLVTFASFDCSLYWLGVKSCTLWKFGLYKPFFSNSRLISSSSHYGFFTCVMTNLTLHLHVSLSPLNPPLHFFFIVQIFFVDHQSSSVIWFAQLLWYCFLSCSHSKSHVSLTAYLLATAAARATSRTTRVSAPTPPWIPSTASANMAASRRTRKVRITFSLN